MSFLSRRDFIRLGAAATVAPAITPALFGQSAGDRPATRPAGVRVLNPQSRVPVSIIIDDSTCLVNLNRFAMPQFDEAHGHKNPAYHRNWRDWPKEIPDSFVRKFADWSAETGVKGKYSIVPYPACVGRLDRELPGWSRTELRDSIRLVREAITPNWDIHPEMVTHTRVIDTRSGHPYPDYSLDFMENWGWTTGKSVDELADYMRYGLRILKEIGLPVSGITTPGGFGNRVLPELAQAALKSVQDIYRAEIPHYFRHLYDSGDRSVAPRVEYASGLSGESPSCVVSIIGCTGDWTGGWDCTPPEGADRFITQDLSKGRMVDVIGRGEPACMVCHWTGVYWNGQELGFKVFQEVVRRLHARFENLIWMKLSEISTYWAAKELTGIAAQGNSILLDAPFACPGFTVSHVTEFPGVPTIRHGQEVQPLREVSSNLALGPGTWCRRGNEVVVCFDLVRGSSRIVLG